MAEKELTAVKVPDHIAFIMDGNGRWAQKRGLPRELGHKAGAETFEKIVRYCGDIGIRTVTVYAFSTENWRRPEKEVNAIIRLLSAYIDKSFESIMKDNIRIIFIGDISVFPKDIYDRMRRVEKESEKNGRVLNIAVNYGGRSEIVHAVNEALRQGKTAISEEDIEANLYTKLSPAPDLVVRTGGELRISNFLLWQSSYAELYFTDTLWPDMTPGDVDKAVEAFRSRKRRYGGV